MNWKLVDSSFWWIWCLGFLRNRPLVEECHFRWITAENYVGFPDESQWTSSEMEVVKSRNVQGGFPMNLFCNTNVFRWICFGTTKFSDESVSEQTCFPMNLFRNNQVVRWIWFATTKFSDESVLEQTYFPMNLFRNNQVFRWICPGTTMFSEESVS